MKNLVILSGAGISAESGIATFRGADGLWEGHRIEDVATPEAWQKDPSLVLEFYNQRRRNVVSSVPNKGHKIIAQLEQHFNVKVITQNVDDLHERAGSSNILHLHGEIRKSRSEIHEHLVYDIEGTELNLGDFCEKKTQLRPHIVWFGEAVPALEEAIPVVNEADILIVIGTSLQVYPAAGLVNFVKPETPIYVIDPASPEVHMKHVTYLKMGGSQGMEEFCLREGVTV